MSQLFSVLAELAAAAGVGLEHFVPAGSEPAPPPDLYVTYAVIPGAVSHAQDGGGSYASDYQLDVYARAVAGERDPVVRALTRAETTMAALDKPLWLVVGPPRPAGGVDEQGYSRTMLLLRRFHSL